LNDHIFLVQSIPFPIRAPIGHFASRLSRLKQPFTQSANLSKVVIEYSLFASLIANMMLSMRSTHENIAAYVLKGTLPIAQMLFLHSKGCHHLFNSGGYALWHQQAQISPLLAEKIFQLI